METATLENVAHLAEKLPPDEQLILVEKLAQGLRRASYKQSDRETTPQDFYGIWKDAFPKDFDVDAALSEIRGEYEAKFEENP